MDAAYSSSWVDLRYTERKSLRFMMQMSFKGNIISHRGQCILSLNTFVWVIIYS